MKTLPVSKLTKNQVQKHVVEGFRIDGGHGKLVISIRYDDRCNNGHNTFSITANLYRDDREWSCGCLHDDIKEFAPQFAHLIKWHLVSSDGPMHYISNTTYHARDTDSDGLRKGEYSAYKLKVVSGSVATDEKVTLYTTGQMYTNKQNNPNLAKSNEKEELKMKSFIEKLKIDHEVIKENSSYSLSEGKKVDIEAARNCAVWPDATFEQLQDKEQLQARLPDLMQEFKTVIESLGMEY